MDLFKRKKKRTELEEEIEDSYDVHEDSDIPVTERITKEKKIRKIK